jgi:RHS repeat-associated protein
MRSKVKIAIPLLIALLIMHCPLFAQLDLNYTRTWVAQKPITNEPDIVSTARTVQEVAVSTGYSDGFGRPVQSVSKQASPLQKDAVSMHIYDNLGREVKSHMPFISNVAQAGDITNDGNFKTNALQQQTAFNQSQYPGENYFYTQVNLENSPLNRTLNSYAQGNSWVGASRGTSMLNLVNTIADNVQIWNIGLAKGSLPYSVGVYQPGQLYKSIATDEKNLQAIQYKDKDGNVVLKKVQLTANADNGSGSVHTGWLCTYFVYDDYGNMRFMITPKVVALIDGNWSISQTVADELCFRYEFDLLNRPVIKKTPGAGEQWMVYDQRGRLVMTQDANLRTKQQWQYFQYDNLDRPITAGIMNDPLNFMNLAYHQNLAATASVNPSYPNTNLYATELLLQTYYDNYNWVSTTGSGLSSSLDQSNTSNANYFYTPSNASFPYPQTIKQTAMVRGLVTGSKTELLGSGGAQYLYTESFYDDKGRIIQTQGSNITGTVDKSTTQYSWTGIPLRVLEQHSKAGTNPQTHTVLTKMSYDFAGRLLTTTKTISSSITNSSTSAVTTISNPEKTIATYAYNELGQLITKRIGTRPNTDFITGPALEILNYDYNIRGWLTGINKYFTQSSNNNGYFGMELAYDKTTSFNGTTSYNNPIYNGSIAGMIWRSKSDGVSRKYDYTYDNANQLTKADFLQNTGGSVWDKTYIDYSVNNISYDYNGNIQNLNQNGFVLGGAPNIDNLTYNYGNSVNNNSNKLMNVVDNSNVPQSKLGDFHYTGVKTSSSVDYDYDLNGNLIKDVNKNITYITYNLLNLPLVVTTAKGTISYTYDASGNKLKKVTQENNVAVSYNGLSYPTNIITTTTYIGSYVYQSKIYSNATLALSILQKTEALQYVFHEEGRARIVMPVSGTPNFAFDYFIKDNLGNVRVTLTDESQIDFYPAATLETAGVATEQLYYNIINDANHIIPVINLPWYASAAGNSYQNNNAPGVPPSVDPTINRTATSAAIYKLKGGTGGDRFGLNITLKVTAGDVVNIFGKSVWHSNTTTSNGGSNALSTVLTSFINAFANTGAVAAGSKDIANGTVLNGSIPFTNDLAAQVNNTLSPLGSQTPKAYINYLFFDEQFKLVQITTTPFDMVDPSPDIVKQHNITNISIPKSGYLFVYCSNESNQDVYFDNLQVTQTRSQLIEENHYYPGGLLMAGISSRAYGKQPSNLGYQGKEMQAGEFYDGSGLDEYDFASRYYDPQLSRWHNQDPAGQFASPYLGMGNNWVNGTDPDGSVFLVDDVIVAAAGFVYGYVSSGIKTGKWGLKSLGNGLLNAAIFEAGYLTAGGGWAAAASAGTARAYLMSSAVSMMAAQSLPSYSVQVGDFTFSISPAFSISSIGFSIGAGYSDGDFSIGASYGFGYSMGTNDLSGNFQKDSKGYYNTYGGNIGFVKHGTYYGGSYAYNSRGGKAHQGIGIIGVQAGDINIRIDEDFFGDGKDRFYTGGGTLTYKIDNNISLAFGLGMITGEKGGYKEETAHYRWFGKIKEKLVTNPDKETPSAYRGGVYYGGIIYKGIAYFAGKNSEKTLHNVQNFIHKVQGTKYFFGDTGKGSSGWFYSGNYSSTSLVY